jgi:hypothetical protein
VDDLAELAPGLGADAPRGRIRCLQLGILLFEVRSSRTSRSYSASGISGSSSTK